MDHPVTTHLRSRVDGIPVGVYSACTANQAAIAACLERGAPLELPVLIEATSNQVNQYGGYTGMLPEEYVRMVTGLAAGLNFPRRRLVLGGDHLGPLPWASEPSEEAMAKGAAMVARYARSGFSKIHLDASMRLGGDDAALALPTELVAARTAALAEASEAAFLEYRRGNPDAPEPVYVVGSEVPIPGGSQEDESLQVTRPEDFQEMLSLMEAAFMKRGLEAAWRRVIAAVVQPGVEFGDGSVHAYDRRKAASLTAALSPHAPLVFEGHSTDYQEAICLRGMVEDGVAILKVGPALTFAYREALFALESIERELPTLRSRPLSLLSDVLEHDMLETPEYWTKHYHGPEEELRLKRRYSYSDRCRYYLGTEAVRNAIAKLFENLRAVEIPDTLLSQFMPLQYRAVRSGRLEKDPAALARDRVGNCVDDYLFAALGDRFVPHTDGDDIHRSSRSVQ